MKNTFLTIFFALLTFLFSYNQKNYSQTFDGTWSCVYATIDDQPNGTGYNVPSVGVVKENTFVALVTRLLNNTCYLVGYTNADSINGRMGYFGYGTSGIGGYRQPWVSGFDQVEMQYAVDLAVTRDSLVFVANNDASSNILVFRMSADSVISTDYRMATDEDSIWAIDIDANGYVYVSSIKSAPDPSKVLIYKGINADPDGWGVNHNTPPIQTITMPEPGQIRGVTVNDAGTIVYVSLYDKDKILCFTGSPATGYTQYNGFNFLLTDIHPTLDVGPWGLNLMKEKNILFVACDVSFSTSGYDYGRIYALNPNTGAFLDTIDCAQWNFDQTGAYNTRPGDGWFGTASGYTSVYNIDFDENFNLYDQSFYGWTVDKWHYSGTLPTIPITIVGVEKDETTVPDQFTLSQNYPNPFNPSTTIEFSLPQEANISLQVYSLTGELITTLIDNTIFSSGNYIFTFDASKLASGNYIYVLTNNEMKLSRKMTLIK